MGPPISSFFCPTRIYMGASSHRELPGLLTEFRCQRLFLAMYAALRETEFAKSLLALLNEAKIAVSIFTEIEPDPSAFTVEKAFVQSRADNPDVILYQISAIVTRLRFPNQFCSDSLVANDGGSSCLFQWRCADWLRFAELMSWAGGSIGYDRH